VSTRVGDGEGTDSMSLDLREFCWPASRLGEALVALARKGGLFHGAREASSLPENAGHGDAFAAWIRTVSAGLGVEAEPAEVNYGKVERWLRRACPALLRLPKMDGPCFLALVGWRRKSLLVLGPDLRVHRFPSHQVSSALCQSIEAPFQQSVERVLNFAGVTRSERARVGAAFLREQLEATPVTGIWLLRPLPGTSFLAQIRQAGLLKSLTGLVCVYTVQYVLGIVAWVVVGWSALEGRFDPGWLMAWVLIILTMLPLQVLAGWYQALLAIGGGGLLKRRLLYGALRLEPEEVRNQGAGQLLGRVIESEAVESLALSAGFVGVLAGIELIIVIAVLAIGAGGWLEASLFVAWITVTSYIGFGLWRHWSGWTLWRLGMTHDLVEKMVGHRTRLAQEPDGRWHQDEDHMVERYLELSQAMDRRGILTSAVVQGWLILGILGLAPAFISGQSSRSALAVGLGGVLLASGTLQKIVSGFASMGGAAIAWAQVSELFHAAARPEVVGSPAFASVRMANSNEADHGHGGTILEAHDLVFRHRSRSEPVLLGVNLRILPNERLLLEGASGAGKSTLAAVLSGLRVSESGVILLGGLDQKTLGSEAWRRRIAMAPQFHENHVLTESFAFNLLMGRRWPPTPEDLAEAEVVCRELGLDELLERMPARLAQRIGEAGWQLSHGERSRLFLARALLQQADLVILDESFAALDPDNLLRALRCASQRANALMVIAHP
jgi:ATP-binding cassette, subfamily B, bacterial